MGEWVGLGVKMGFRDGLGVQDDLFNKRSFEKLNQIDFDIYLI